jgi:hypothetical protein
MKEEGPARGYNTLYLGVPDAEDELDFIKRLIRAFRDTDWAPGGWVDVFRSKLPDRSGGGPENGFARAEGEEL